MRNKIDLHIHSNASDGSNTIPELLEIIQKAGIHTFAITDHDTIEGALEMDKLVPDTLHYIRGIEFSSITPYGNCHILGYGFNPDNKVFQDTLAFGKQLRQEKLERRIKFLKSEYGIELTPEESEWLYSQKSPGKPHFGIILAERGLAPDIRSAINTYIAPCKDGNDRIDADVAINAIRQAGGTAVWAHPLGGEGEKRLSHCEFAIQLEQLITDGIQGLECYYSRYDMKDVTFLVEQAEKHGLLVSAGSDFHGKNKNELYIGKLNAEEKVIAEEIKWIEEI